jgi:hypothetical protein
VAGGPFPQGAPGWSLTARTDRAHSYRARSVRTALLFMSFYIFSPSVVGVPIPQGVRGRSLTARVQRAHSDRARCASKRDHPAPPASSSSHRPLFLLPRHLPKHPLVPRADHERLFHPLLLSLSHILYPLIHLRTHPPLHLGELR